MKLSRYVSIVTAFLLAFGIFAWTFSYAERDISVCINGEEIVFDVPPVIQNGRTLVPMRKIFETLGATVEWDGGTRTVSAQRGERTFSLRVGGKEYFIDRQKFPLDVSATIAGGRTLIPVRLVAEAFDCEVTWDSATRSVRIVCETTEIHDEDSDKNMNPNGNPNVGGAHLSGEASTVGKLHHKSTAISSPSNFTSGAGKRIVMGKDPRNTFEATISGNIVHIRGRLAYDEFNRVWVELYRGEDLDNLEYHDDYLNQRYEESPTYENWQYSHGELPLDDDKAFDIEIRLHDSAVHNILLFGIYEPEESEGDRYPDDGDEEKDYVTFDNGVLYIVKTGDEYRFVSAKEHGHNLEVMKNIGDPKKYLNTEHMDPDTRIRMKTLSDSIVAGATTDREKLLKIHDWMTNNMFYNYDYDNITDRGENFNSPLDVIANRRSQCYGFSILFTDLVRLQGIPSTKVIGYIRTDAGFEEFSKDVENLHAWNVAYADGEWMHIDVTWDIENHVTKSVIYRKMPSHSYFDVDLSFFSLDHYFDYFREEHEWY